MGAPLMRADQSLGKDGNSMTVCQPLVDFIQGDLPLPGRNRYLAQVAHKGAQNRHRKSTVRDADADRLAGYQVNQKWVCGTGVVGGKDLWSHRQILLPLDVDV